MNCPQCGGDQCRAINTRHDSPESILRQRRCLDCDHNFHTVELDLPTGAVSWRRQGNQSNTMYRKEGFTHAKFW